MGRKINATKGHNERNLRDLNLRNLREIFLFTQIWLNLADLNKVNKKVHAAHVGCVIFYYFRSNHRIPEGFGIAKNIICMIKKI